MTDDYLRALGKQMGDSDYCCYRCSTGKIPKAGDLVHRWPRPRLSPHPDTTEPTTTLTPHQRHQLRLDTEAGHKGARTMAARKAISDVASDPNFKDDLAASRKRIERALALASVVIERLAENGAVAEDFFEKLQKLAATHKSLSSTVEIDLDKLTDEQLAALDK